MTIDLRMMFIISAAVGTLFGLYFLFFTGAAIDAFGLAPADGPALILARSVGIGILAVSVISAFAPGDWTNSMVRGLVYATIGSHALAVVVEFTASHPRPFMVWVGLLIHILFIAGFIYVLTMPKSVGAT